MKPKKYIREAMGRKVYNHPTAEEAANIIDNWRDNAKITVDGIDFALEPCWGMKTNDSFDLWSEEGFFYCKSKDELIKILQDVHGAIKTLQDEDAEYNRKALPSLWKQYKDNEWMTPDGKYVDGEFSDYYKDVFGHRPRSAAQIESEIKALANKLGVTLNESCKGRRKPRVMETLGEICDFDKHPTHRFNKVPSREEIEQILSNENGVANIIVKGDFYHIATEDDGWYWVEDKRRGGCSDMTLAKFLYNLAHPENVDKARERKSINIINADRENHIRQLYQDVDTVKCLYDLNNEFTEYIGPELPDDRESIKAAIKKAADKYGIQLESYKKSHLKEEVENYANKAWMLNAIISSMTHKDAYYGNWIYVWTDGETKAECKYDFGTKAKYKELENSFKKIYTHYHKYGLFQANPKVLAAAHEWDKQLKLDPIVDEGEVKTQIDNLQTYLDKFNVTPANIEEVDKDGNPDGYTIDLGFGDHNFGNVRALVNELKQNYSSVEFDFYAAGGPHIYIKK